MNTRNESSHMIDMLFILTLFLVFILSSISVVGIGIKVYRSIVQDMNTNYDSRTAVSYVTEKIREADQNGSIAIGRFHEQDALILTQYVNETPYSTYLYVYDGSLCELFTPASSDLPLNSGQKILEIEAFDIEAKQDNLFHIRLRPAKSQNIDLYLTTHSDPPVE
ncbi:MAG: DUF4860 domain-containing protein [Lachnospiraceae bacterium]|nr:DUF4860 domain-containing protein [Lachnospiraceae bacterium]